MKCAFSAFLILCGLFCRVEAAELQVFAAASLTDVLQETARAYSDKSGDKVVFNFAASSILARQIDEGAPADIFISADEEKMDWLEQRKLIKTGTRISLLENSLVIVVAADSTLAIQSPRDLLSSKRIVLAETTVVPSGIYARRYLENVGLWNSLQGKIIPTENVRAALSAVENGNVDAGIVYKTDAAISKKVKIAFAVPRKDAPRITYPFAVTTASKHPVAAERYLKFLASEESRKLFVKHGFIVQK